METVENIATVIGLITASIALITLVIGYVRSLSKIKDGMKALLRNNIEHCYYKNLEKKTLREYERKNLDSLYGAYHDVLKGNSFASDLYEQMRDWTIIR